MDILLQAVDRVEGVEQDHTYFSVAQAPCVSTEHILPPPQQQKLLPIVPSYNYEVAEESDLRHINKKSKKYQPWTEREDISLVKCVALYQDQWQETSSSAWPSIREEHPFWQLATRFIHEECQTLYFRSEGSVRNRVVHVLRKRYKNIDVAEDQLRISYDGSDCHNNATGSGKTSPDVMSFVKEVRSFSLEKKKEFILQILSPDEYSEVADQLYYDSHCAIDSAAPKDFVSKSLCAVRTLSRYNENTDLIYRLSRCLGEEREDGTPLMPLKRMPHGALKYNIEFFSSTNISQVKMPHDYCVWLESLSTECTAQQYTLIRGLGWPGSKGGPGDPLDSKMNLAAHSLQSIRRQIREDQDFLLGGVLQEKMVIELVKTYPGKEWHWLCMDPCDVKVALQESGKREWNGDEDLGDGRLQEMKVQYELRRTNFVELLKLVDVTAFKNKLGEVIVEIEKDEDLLKKKEIEAVKVFSAKIDMPGISEERKKQISWECVETHTLHTQAKAILTSCQKIKNCVSNNLEDYKSTIQELREPYMQYLTQVFKKRRTAATHAMFFMVVSEMRRQKPYAIPIMYLPFKSMKDQQAKDIMYKIKSRLVSLGLNIIGMVTDNEFHTFRTQGQERPTHLWQIVTTCRTAVAHMRKATLENFILTRSVTPDGRHIPFEDNAFVPQTVLQFVYKCLQEDNWSMEDVVVYLRREIIPPEYRTTYDPYPYRRDIPESHLDRLKSLISTFIFRDTLRKYFEEGVDFKLHFYVPEMDVETGRPMHHRNDHCHQLKCIAGHTRELRYIKLRKAAFDGALEAPETGLTHAALVGLRKQSVPDAEKLLSYAVAEWMENNGFDFEGNYIRTIAQWHEASDGRGLTQLQRSRYNHKMLLYISEELMPWIKDGYDFSWLDINRPLDDIRGFSRESFIGITANIESQELRRCDSGPPEHPRAGTTDSVENFISVIHHYLGDHFTLEELKFKYRRIAREFVKKIDPQLPFYHPSGCERYREEEEPFDNKPGGPSRLHTVKFRRREDGSLFVPGRVNFPSKGATSTRNAYHKFDVGMPPVPQRLLDRFTV